jgi:hypothetical protein
MVISRLAMVKSSESVPSDWRLVNGGTVLCLLETEEEGAVVGAGAPKGSAVSRRKTH